MIIFGKELFIFIAQNYSKV